MFLNKLKILLKRIVYIAISICLIIILQQNFNVKTNALIEEKIDICKKANSIEDKFKNVTLGMKEKDIVEFFGEPNRKDYSEYGFKWYVYNKYENIFFMIGIENSKVVGLYSNTTYNNYLENISLHITTKDEVRDNYKLSRDRIHSQLNGDEYDILRDIMYSTTVFYDVHKNNVVTSFELINNKYKISHFIDFSMRDSLANSKYYKEELKKSFENQMIDLINSTRVEFGLNTLEYDKERATNSAREHSLDMRDNNYFSHNNLEGLSSADRMSNVNIEYIACGENLAGGQQSAIYAHEGLMNSKGHRETILHTVFEYVGVGVEIGDKKSDYKTYYTQNYYTE